MTPDFATRMARGFDEWFTVEFGRSPTLTWERGVCPECSGQGMHSKHLGAFTPDEMHEMGDEFIDDYLGGAYDMQCEHCNGNRVVDEPTGGFNYPEWLDYQREMYDLARVEAQERMMGA